jgi:hypothetical protein
VLIVEDTAKELVIPNSSYPAEYTIIYQLEDSRVLGGSPAILKSVAGLIHQAAYTDAAVLGWVKYPGGSIPLAISHFIQPARLRVEPKVASMEQTFLSPFPQMIRQTSDIKGSSTLRSFNLADISVTQTQTISLGLASRMLRCSIMTSANVAASMASYLTIEIKKGTNTLFSFDTRPTLQNGLAANVPSYFIQNSLLPLSNFIFSETEVVTLVITKTGSITGIAAQFNLVLESPPSTGNWIESQEEYAGEKFTKFINSSAESSPKTYEFQLPFLITGSGSPKKLISRLTADFNCMVTFTVKIEGNTITLEPSGSVENTGGVVTREFTIPTAYEDLWLAGRTAYINVLINAQAGRSVSFSHISLNMESSPFLLFTN